MAEPDFIKPHSWKEVSYLGFASGTLTIFGILALRLFVATAYYVTEVQLNIRREMCKMSVTLLTLGFFEWK